MPPSPLQRIGEAWCDAAVSVLCPVCSVPQLIVGGVGVLRQHDRIDLVTGVGLGPCDGSGESATVKVRETGARPCSQPSPVRKRCKVCGANAWMDPTFKDLGDHAFPKSDARCRASGMRFGWLPQTQSEGRPVVAHSTGERLDPNERSKWSPLTSYERRREEKFERQNARDRARWERERKRESEPQTQVVSGGAPGLGKRR